MVQALSPLVFLTLSTQQHQRLVRVLLFGNFVIGTGAMMVAGMLNQLSVDLNQTVPQTAQLLTAFALVCGLGAPLLALGLATVGRRAVLCAALLLYALGHVLAVFTQTFAVLVALRAFTAIGAAIFTPQAAATVGMLTPPAQRGKAIGLVFLGWGFASVLGLPLGSWLAATYHWQAAMAVVAGLSVVAAAGVFWAVPNGVYGQAIGMPAFRALLSDRKTMAVVGVTVLSASGLFCMFAYLAPLLRGEVHATAQQIPFLFAVYGLAGVLGSVAATQVVDRKGAATIVGVCLGATLLMLVLWPLASLHLGLAFVIAFAWGLPGFACNGTQQTRLMAMSGAMAPVAVALNSSALYIEQAIGTVSGGLYYAHAPHLFLPWLAAAFVGLALLLSHHAQKTLGV